MAHEYSYREMKRMQEDAIQRVWEMQKRATLPIETKTKEVDEKAHEEAKKHQQPKPSPKQQPRQQARQRNQNDFITKIPDKINHILKDDELCEQILLISIIILLMNDNADNILILAILYILAD